MSANLRSRSIDGAGQRLLLTRFTNSGQEEDLTKPPNCGGFGRIHHFRRGTGDTWPRNPLPMDQACRALGLAPSDLLQGQGFQNAACNWRCWYCFVPFEMLSANPKHSAWVSVPELVDFYLSEAERSPVIDLSGGQPDLIPEWVPWMMRELSGRGLSDSTYLWSDDNLSNDYFWRYLTDVDRSLLASYRNYGRVCCFKGLDQESFSFNTKAHPSRFDEQFTLMDRLLGLGLDLYAYVTLTTPVSNGIGDAVARFVDRLQELDSNLPLRTVPLEIREYSPVESRLTPLHEEAMSNQYLAVDAWRREIEARFSPEEQNANISVVPLKGGQR